LFEESMPRKSLKRGVKKGSMFGIAVATAERMVRRKRSA